MTPNPTITVTVRDTAGEPLLDGQGMSLLFGVPLADIHALPPVGGGSPIPREWVKRGRRRAREAMARTGSDNVLDVLDYWADKEHGTSVTVVYE